MRLSNAKLIALSLWNSILGLCILYVVANMNFSVPRLILHEGFGFVATLARFCLGLVDTVIKHLDLVAMMFVMILVDCVKIHLCGSRSLLVVQLVILALCLENPTSMLLATILYLVILAFVNMIASPRQVVVVVVPEREDSKERRDEKVRQRLSIHDVLPLIGLSMGSAFTVYSFVKIFGLPVHPLGFVIHGIALSFLLTSPQLHEVRSRPLLALLCSIPPFGIATVFYVLKRGTGSRIRDLRSLLNSGYRVSKG